MQRRLRQVLASGRERVNGHKRTSPGDVPFPCLKRTCNCDRNSTAVGVAILRLQKLPWPRDPNGSRSRLGLQSLRSPVQVRSPTSLFFLSSIHDIMFVAPKHSTRLLPLFCSPTYRQRIRNAGAARQSAAVEGDSKADSDTDVDAHSQASGQSDTKVLARKQREYRMPAKKLQSEPPRDTLP